MDAAANSIKNTLFVAPRPTDRRLQTMPTGGRRPSAQPFRSGYSGPTPSISPTSTAAVVRGGAASNKTCLEGSTAITQAAGAGRRWHRIIQQT